MSIRKRKIFVEFPRVFAAKIALYRPNNIRIVKFAYILYNININKQQRGDCRDDWKN